jgi:hypothetical protein
VPVFFGRIRPGLTLYLLKGFLDLGFGLLAPFLNRAFISPTLFDDMGVGDPDTIATDRAVEERFVHVKTVVVFRMPREPDASRYDELRSESRSRSFDGVDGYFQTFL